MLYLSFFKTFFIKMFVKLKCLIVLILSIYFLKLKKQIIKYFCFNYDFILYNQLFDIFLRFF